MKVKEHYDKHLGNFYSWMAGDLQQKCEEHRNYFRSKAIFSDANAAAFDLGSGHGIQSLALASLGFQVTAVDFSTQLLHELEINRGDAKIKTINSDLLSFLRNNNETASVIACMGDTLTHLESANAVNELFSLSHQRLKSQGKLVLSFREFTSELKNEQRFIPVKSDDQKILTCFLEYFSDHVMVHDILQEKENGKWTQKISAYPKLRLSESFVTDMLIKNGFSISASETMNRMLCIVAEKV
jgi:2-polyprenyl-3-methyl-5-hydroxy-6-metoxy-1,4-benzoquinol methylase